MYYLEEKIKNQRPIQSEHLIATLLHPRLRDFCGDRLLKHQAIELLQLRVASYTNSFNNDSSSVDKPITYNKTNILSLCFDEVMLWIQSDFDTEIIDDDLLFF